MNVTLMLLQALLWTTIGALLYIAWLQRQATSPLQSFTLSEYLTGILDSINVLWIIIGVSLIITFFIFLPRPANATVPTTCNSSDQSVAVSNSSPAGTGACATPQPTPASSQSTACQGIPNTGAANQSVQVTQTNNSFNRRSRSTAYLRSPTHCQE